MPVLGRPVAFIAATDLDRARRFYEEVLGLRFVADEGVALLFDVPGMPLRVTRVEQFAAQPFRFEDPEGNVLSVSDRI